MGEFFKRGRDRRKLVRGERVSSLDQALRLCNLGHYFFRSDFKDERPMHGGVLQSMQLWVVGRDVARGLRLAVRKKPCVRCGTTASNVGVNLICNQCEAILVEGQERIWQGQE